LLVSFSIATFVARLLQRWRTSRSGHEPEKAGWDREILAIELQHLMEIELDFDISATGFEVAEIDVLIEDLDAKPAKADPADEVPVVSGPAVTRPGDLWQVGPHRLICGDALDADTYTRLLAGETAQLVFTALACAPPARPRPTTSGLTATSRASVPPSIASSRRAASAPSARRPRAR
jgi:hypothetical protein